MTIDHKARLAKEARDRISVVQQVLGLLPPALATETAVIGRGPNNTSTVRSDRGTLVVQATERSVAQFVVDAPGHLRFLSWYVGYLEQQAFESREAHRQRDQLLDTLCDELAAADGHGVHTKDGQRRVRSAIDAARGRRC